MPDKEKLLLFPFAGSYICQVLSGKPFGTTDSMRTLIIFFIILFPGTLCAQTPPSEKHHSERTIAERERDARAFLDSAQRVNDPVEIAEAWYRLAKLEHSKMNLLKSNQNLLRSIRLLEKRGPSYELGRNYYWLAINARKMRDKKSTFENIEKALSVHHACNSDKGKAMVYGFLSNLYENYIPYAFDDPNLVEPNYSKALFYANLSYQYAAKLDDKRMAKDMELLIPQLSKLAQGMAQPHLMELDLETVKKENINTYIIYSLDYSRYLGQKGETGKSLEVLEATRKLIEQYTPESKKHLEFYERAAADYYTHTGDLRRAMEHLEKYHDYHTHGLMEDRQGAISELLISYETEKKETELKIQEHSLQNTRKLLGLSSVSLLLTLGLSTFLFRLYKKKQSISRKNVLLVQEQNHRVKNNLQVVSSLLNLQANMLADPMARQAIEEAQLRITAMIHLHRQLYENGQVDRIDMDRFIPDLTESVFESFDLRHVTLVTETGGILLPADTATLLGLLINELVTNACKYAFAGHPAPRLTIRLKSEPGKSLQLTVKDNGRQYPDLDRSPSFGSRLIRMMVTQLDGKSEYNYHNGLEFQLTF